MLAERACLRVAASATPTGAWQGRCRYTRSRRSADAPYAGVHCRPSRRSESGSSLAPPGERTPPPDSARAWAALASAPFLGLTPLRPVIGNVPAVRDDVECSTGAAGFRRACFARRLCLRGLRRVEVEGELFGGFEVVL